MPDPQGLQEIPTDPDLFLGLIGQRHAHGIADPGPKQRAQTDRRLHGAHAPPAGLGNADMQRVIADFGQLLIRRDGQEHVRGFHADLEVVEIVLLENIGVVQRAFDQRFRVGFAVFLQQMPLQ